MNSSREAILSRLAAHKPSPVPLPATAMGSNHDSNLLEKFSEVAINIGSQVFRVQDYAAIAQSLHALHPGDVQIVSVLPEKDLFPAASLVDSHQLAGVEVAILEGQFGVAENSAIWLSEQQMGQRALPFICQHLALVLREQDLLATMHQAYERIGNADYGFGTFIAGPSKTADIEQSLVLGAHGPRSLSIFILP